MIRFYPFLLCESFVPPHYAVYLFMKFCSVFGGKWRDFSSFFHSTASASEKGIFNYLFLFRISFRFLRSLMCELQLLIMGSLFAGSMYIIFLGATSVLAFWEKSLLFWGTFWLEMGGAMGCYALLLVESSILDHHQRVKRWSHVLLSACPPIRGDSLELSDYKS